MFLPSFFAPVLARYAGLRGMMLLGLISYCIAIAVGYSDNSTQGFWMQLVLLGVGWNFLFTAGTTLLPSTHQEEDRFKKSWLAAIFGFTSGATGIDSGL